MRVCRHFLITSSGATDINSCRFSLQQDLRSS